MGERGWTWVVKAALCRCRGPCAGFGWSWVDVGGRRWGVGGGGWGVGGHGRLRIRRGWSRVVKGADEGIVHCGQGGRYSPLASPVRGGLGLTGTTGRTEGGLSDEVVERSEEDSPSRSDNMGSEARFAEVAANPQEAFSVRCGVGGGTEERRDSPLATQRAYGSPRAARAVLGGSNQEELPGGDTKTTQATQACRLAYGGILAL